LDGLPDSFRERRGHRPEIGKAPNRKYLKSFMADAECDAVPGAWLATGIGAGRKADAVIDR